MGVYSCYGIEFGGMWHDYSGGGWPVGSRLRGSTNGVICSGVATTEGGRKFGILFGENEDGIDAKPGSRTRICNTYGNCSAIDGNFGGR